MPGRACLAAVDHRAGAARAFSFNGNFVFKGLFSKEFVNDVLEIPRTRIQGLV
jgi:hypothetical protein